MSPSGAPSELPSHTPSDTPTVSMAPWNILSMTFATAFDGDYCNYHQECRERPKYPSARSQVTSPGVKRARKAEPLKALTLGGKKKKKKTNSPSSMPTTLPSKSPLHSPSDSPSDVPSTVPSTTPSSMPSSMPSAHPSLTPSNSPSAVPSSSPSTNPSSTPSVTPSKSPSNIPSLNPSESPSSMPSILPSLSMFPSAAPQHYGLCIENTCQAEPLVIERPSCQDHSKNWHDIDGRIFNCGWYAQGNRCTLYGNRFQRNGYTASEACCVCGGGDRIPSESCVTTFLGSYGNSANNGTHDQDYAGGVVVGPNSTITSMFGNAWKAYELCEPYELSKTSHLQFNFTVTEEAEGHAICLDEGKNCFGLVFYYYKPQNN